MWKRRQPGAAPSLFGPSFMDVQLCLRAMKGMLRKWPVLVVSGIAWGVGASPSTLSAAVVATTSLTDQQHWWAPPRPTAEYANATRDDGGSAACAMWIAPSTIPGAGLGMFAGREFGLWEPIGSPDLVIPIVDYHVHHPEHDGEIIFDFYGWNMWSFPQADIEGHSPDESTAFCPGAGAALNCMLSLVNTVAMDDKVRMDQAGLHRSKDPGSGAFTPFHDRQLISRGGVRAGDELFDSYGDAYFADREAIFGKIPLEGDPEKADKLLSSYMEVKESVCRQPNQTASSGQCGTLHSDWYGLLVSLQSLWPSRVLNALPTDSDRVDQIHRSGTAFTHYERSRRTPEWLAQNGLCMDHLRIQTSTLPQAGRGAFAQRDLRKGTVVAPAPAIHVPRELLTMRPTVYRSGRAKIDARASPNHHQLVLNYCWGHRDSSVVLCPYGSVTSAINHSRKAANVRLQWNENLVRHPEWLHMPIHEWVDEMHAGLMFDFVAIRDIVAGEEILVDYGEEWEAAWEAHVTSWTSPSRATSYVDAVHRNEQETVLRTVTEGHYDETYTRLHCRKLYLTWSGIETDDPDDDDDDDIDDDYTKLLPCRVIVRERNDEGDYVYTAVTTEAASGAKRTKLQTGQVVFGLPRDAFVFVDEALERDHAQPWAFRHDARIPDDIFPDVWRDLLPR